MGGRPDIREDLVSDEEYERNCAHYADWAFYSPPEQFLFRHYDEPESSPRLIARRPMVGIEKYVVQGETGGYYGVYDTRDVTKYLRTGTWVEIKEPGYFERQELSALERQVVQKREELAQAVGGNSHG